MLSHLLSGTLASALLMAACGTYDFGVPLDCSPLPRENLRVSVAESVGEIELRVEGPCTSPRCGARTASGACLELISSFPRDAQDVCFVPIKFKNGNSLRLRTCAPYVVGCKGLAIAPAQYTVVSEAAIRYSSGGDGGDDVEPSKLDCDWERTKADNVGGGTAR